MISTEVLGYESSDYETKSDENSLLNNEKIKNKII